MSRLNPRNKPYALKAGEGWTYRFGIDLTVKAGEVQQGSRGGGFTGDLASGHGELVAKPPHAG